MRKTLSQSDIDSIKLDVEKNVQKTQICLKFKISRTTLYNIISGRPRKQSCVKYENVQKLRGLTIPQLETLSAIAKNRDVSRNRLMLSYIKTGISNEPEQNKYYED